MPAKAVHDPNEASWGEYAGHSRELFAGAVRYSHPAWNAYSSLETGFGSVTIPVA